LDWSGKVKEVNFEAGDIVHEGDVLAVVENDNLSGDIAAANNSLKQQEISLQKQVDQLDRTIEAPASGRVKELKARRGEDATSTTQTYGQLCWIIQDEMMELTVELDYPTEVGYTFEVEDLDYNRYFAEVTAVSEKSANIATMDIHTDELDIDEEVWVFYYGRKDNHLGVGKVNIKNGIKVTGSGKISDIYVENDQYITRGDLMFRLDNKDAMLTYESQTISVSEAQRKLVDLRKDLGKSDLPAPVSGVLLDMNILKGQNANSGVTIARIQDHINLQTVINIDELDIAKIKVGQKVEITLEALEGKVYKGTVEKIAVVGNSTNNFATYPVTISIDDPGEIKIGMSCEATIQIESAKNTTIVPVEMLKRSADGYSILVVTEGLDVDSAQQRAEEEMSADGSGASLSGDQARFAMRQSMTGIAPPAGMFGDTMSVGVVTEERQVKVGLINEDYAQIIEGLEIGEWVARQVKTASIMDMMMGGGGGGQTVTYVSEPAEAPRSR